MDETDEVAAGMLPAAPAFRSMDDAIRYVRAKMPGETETIISNVAESLYRDSARKSRPWKLSYAQACTINAALRVYQHILDGGYVVTEDGRTYGPKDFAEVATSGGEISAMSSDEIDDFIASGLYP